MLFNRIWWYFHEPHSANDTAFQNKGPSDSPLSSLLVLQLLRLHTSCSLIRLPDMVRSSLWIRERLADSISGLGWSRAWRHHTMGLKVFCRGLFSFASYNLENMNMDSVCCTFTSYVMWAETSNRKWECCRECKVVTCRHLDWLNDLAENSAVCLRDLC